MCDPAGQTSNRLQLLELPELLFTLSELFGPFLDSGLECLIVAKQ